MSVRLPVFPLAPAEVDADLLGRLADGLFEAGSVDVEEGNHRLTARAGSVVIETDRVSGGIWAADQKQLWNADAEPSLPSEREVGRRASGLLAELDLLPAFSEDGFFALTELPIGGTRVAEQTKGERRTRMLDLQARYAVGVRNPDVPGQPDLLPVVGGGGKFALALGDGGRPIAYRGLWRHAGRPVEADALELSEAQERLRELTKDVELHDPWGYLAYHSAPFGAEQSMLAPVWVFGGTIRAGRRKMAARMITIPATEHGPFYAEPQPQKHRQRKPGQLVLRSRRGTGDEGVKEAGTSWIGLSGGLGGSQQNARGFVDGLAADGWTIRFNWGDGNAWESDWRRNDDTWVDAVDFVFYTGHADKDSWMLASPDDGSLTASEVGAAPAAASGDLWGKQDLEWVIVAACGPLQDEVISDGGGSVLSRWDGAFDGLHVLMGYGAITFDNEEEGERVVEYARQGTRVIDAWFRTAQEIQPSTNGADPPNGPTVWVGAMWVRKSGVDPRNDHIWGHGSVSADPTSPTTLICMWTTC